MAPQNDNSTSDMSVDSWKVGATHNRDPAAVAQRTARQLRPPVTVDSIYLLPSLVDWLAKALMGPRYVYHYDIDSQWNSTFLYYVLQIVTDKDHLRESASFADPEERWKHIYAHYLVLVPQLRVNALKTLRQLISRPGLDIERRVWIAESMTYYRSLEPPEGPEIFHFGDSLKKFYSKLEFMVTFSDEVIERYFENPQSPKKDSTFLELDMADIVSSLIKLDKRYGHVEAHTSS